MLGTADWMSNAIPLSIHGDAIPIVAVGKPNTQSLDVTSMQGTLSTGSAAEVKHLLYSCFEKCKTEESESEVGKTLRWSFEALFSGKHPSVDQHGNPYPEASANAAIAGQDLASGMFGVIFMVKGDLDHYSKLGLPDYRSNFPCNYCPCDRGDAEGGKMSFTNFNRTSPWKSRLYSMPQWRAALKWVCWIFQIHYLSCHNVEADELHVIHIGFSQYLAGATLWLLIFKITRGTVNENLEMVWQKIVEFYTTNNTRCQLSNLQLTMFTDSKKSEKSMPYPRLKARGAETKHLIPALLYSWDALAKKSRSPF